MAGRTAGGGREGAERSGVERRGAERRGGGRGEGGQRRRRRQKGKKLKGGPGIESTCWVVVVVGRIHGDRKPRLDPKEDVFRFEKKKLRKRIGSIIAQRGGRGGGGFYLSRHR